MEKRVRLTERVAVDGTIAYPGNVNQPDRTFKDHKQYDNWTEVVNHPLPDLATEWKNDKHDENGFGIPEDWDTSAGPRMASIRVAADKAVRVAAFLLGERVADSIVEEQARDLMLMGGDALDRTLERFHDTQDLYAADEEADEEATEEVTEAADEEATEEVTEAAADEAAEEVTEEAEVTAEEESKEEEEAAAESETEDVTTANDIDIELQASLSDLGADHEADSLIASLFDEVSAELAPREASEKEGIKSLGGQPKVASSEADSVDALSKIWDDRPDVNHIFNN